MAAPTTPLAPARVSGGSRQQNMKDKTLPKQKLDKTSWEYILKSGLAGGLAGCAVSPLPHPLITTHADPTQAKTVVGPLDRVKILFQASNPQFAKYTGSWFGVATAIRDIFAQDGVRGLFRGHSATLLRIFPYAGIKFLAYEQIRARIIPNAGHETAARRFASGSLAGMVSVFFTYPLEVLRVRLAFETKREGRSTLRSICRKIYYEHPPPPRGLSAVGPAAVVVPQYGLANFFRGFTPTMWGMLPYAGASFLAHDSASDALRLPALAPLTTVPGTARPDAGKPAQLKYWAELATGGFAGFVSQTVSYPLEVIRRRMQVGGVVGDGHRLRMGETARIIWAERGWRGFFVGLGIGYVKVVPMVATSFFAYERAKFYLGI